MHLAKYLERKFPNFELIPPFQEQWQYVIHQPFGRDISPYHKDGKIDQAYFESTLKEAKQIFDFVFAKEDSLYLVTNIYVGKNNRFHKKLKIYPPNIIHKDLLKKLRVHTYPFTDVDEEEPIERQQFELLCKRKDLTIDRLLKSILHIDFPSLHPRIEKGNVRPTEVFFIHQTKGILLWIYDDRGCEIVFHSEQQFHEMKEKLSKEILS